MSSDCAYAIEKATVKCSIPQLQVSVWWASKQTVGWCTQLCFTQLAILIFLRGDPKNDPITSCPCTHLHMQLALEVTNFEAGWPVTDSDFKWLLQWLRCLLQEPKGKWNKEKQRGSLLKTVQKIVKFYAHVHEIYWPHRQKQQSRSVKQLTNNVHLATSARSIC